MKGFSELATPLTDLTKKGDFVWTEGAQAGFDRLKEVMRCFPVLELPNFSQPFTLECDASGVGIGVVLSQGGHSIAFESRKLLPHELSYSIYDKEMLAGNQFKVKLDHNSLRHFMG